MKIKELIASDEQAFLDLCRSHKVVRLYAFGSAVTDSFDDEHSDIDLLIDVGASNPLERGSLLLSFLDKAKLFFKKPIDLLTEQSIRNQYLKKSIDQTKVLLYGQ